MRHAMTACACGDTRPKILSARMASGRRKVRFRVFFGNDRWNGNGWRMTWKSIRECIHTALGGHGVLLLECSLAGCTHVHPDEHSANDCHDDIPKQGRNSVARVVDYELDNVTRTAWLIMESDNRPFIELIERGDIRYVSPGVCPIKEEPIGVNGRLMLTEHRWRFLHIAFVDTPAYGNQAQVRDIGMIGPPAFTRQVAALPPGGADLLSDIRTRPGPGWRARDAVLALMAGHRDQPRAPAGSPKGGQWIKAGAGGLAAPTLDEPERLKEDAALYPDEADEAPEAMRPYHRVTEADDGSGWFIRAQDSTGGWNNLRGFVRKAPPKRHGLTFERKEPSKIGGIGELYSDQWRDGEGGFGELEARINTIQDTVEEMVAGASSIVEGVKVSLDLDETDPNYFGYHWRKHDDDGNLESVELRVNVNKVLDTIPPDRLREAVTTIMAHELAHLEYTDLPVERKKVFASLAMEAIKEHGPLNPYHASYVRSAMDAVGEADDTDPLGWIADNWPEISSPHINTMINETHSILLERLPRDPRRYYSRDNWQLKDNFVSLRLIDGELVKVQDADGGKVNDADIGGYAEAWEGMIHAYWSAFGRKDSLGAKLKAMRPEAVTAALTASRRVMALVADWRDQNRHPPGSPEGGRWRKEGGTAASEADVKEWVAKTIRNYPPSAVSSDDEEGHANLNAAVMKEYTDAKRLWAESGYAERIGVSLDEVAGLLMASVDRQIVERDLRGEDGFILAQGAMADLKKMGNWSGNEERIRDPLDPKWVNFDPKEGAMLKHAPPDWLRPEDAQRVWRRAELMVRGMWAGLDGKTLADVIHPSATYKEGWDRQPLGAWVANPDNAGGVVYINPLLILQRHGTSEGEALRKLRGVFRHELAHSAYAYYPETLVREWTDKMREIGYFTPYTKYHHIRAGSPGPLPEDPDAVIDDYDDIALWANEMHSGINELQAYGPDLFYRKDNEFMFRDIAEEAGWEDDDLDDMRSRYEEARRWHDRIFGRLSPMTHHRKSLPPEGPDDTPWHKMLPAALMARDYKRHPKGAPDSKGGQFAPHEGIADAIEPGGEIEHVREWTTSRLPLKSYLGRDQAAFHRMGDLVSDTIADVLGKMGAGVRGLTVVEDPHPDQPDASGSYDPRTNLIHINVAGLAAYFLDGGERGHEYTEEGARRYAAAVLRHEIAHAVWNTYPIEARLAFAEDVLKEGDRFVNGEEGIGPLIPYHLDHFKRWRNNVRHKADGETGRRERMIPRDVEWDDDMTREWSGEILWDDLLANETHSMVLEAVGADPAWYYSRDNKAMRQYGQKLTDEEIAEFRASREKWLGLYRKHFGPTGLEAMLQKTRVAAAALATMALVAAYDPNQPRDRFGKWTRVRGEGHPLEYERVSPSEVDAVRDAYMLLEDAGDDAEQDRLVEGFDEIQDAVEEAMQDAPALPVAGVRLHVAPHPEDVDAVGVVQGSKDLRYHADPEGIDDPSGLEVPSVWINPLAIMRDVPPDRLREATVSVVRHELAHLEWYLHSEEKRSEYADEVARVLWEYGPMNPYHARFLRAAITGDWHGLGDAGRDDVEVDGPEALAALIKKNAWIQHRLVNETHSATLEALGRDPDRYWSLDGAMFSGKVVGEVALRHREGGGWTLVEEEPGMMVSGPSGYDSPATEKDLEDYRKSHAAHLAAYERVFGRSGTMASRFQARVAALTAAYDPNQPRDRFGKWTRAGGAQKVTEDAALRKKAIDRMREYKNDVAFNADGRYDTMVEVANEVLERTGGAGAAHVAVAAFQKQGEEGDDGTEKRARTLAMYLRKHDLIILRPDMIAMAARGLANKADLRFGQALERTVKSTLMHEIAHAMWRRYDPAKRRRFTAQCRRIGPVNFYTRDTLRRVMAGEKGYTWTLYANEIHSALVQVTVEGDRRYYDGEVEPDQPREPGGDSGIDRATLLFSQAAVRKGFEKNLKRARRAYARQFGPGGALSTAARLADDEAVPEHVKWVGINGHDQATPGGAFLEVCVGPDSVEVVPAPAPALAASGAVMALMAGHQDQPRHPPGSPEGGRWRVSDASSKKWRGEFDISVRGVKPEISDALNQLYYLNHAGIPAKRTREGEEEAYRALNGMIRGPGWRRGDRLEAMVDAAISAAKKERGHERRKVPKSERAGAPGLKRLDEEIRHLEELKTHAHEYGWWAEEQPESEAAMALLADGSVALEPAADLNSPAWGGSPQ